MVTDESPTRLEPGEWRDLHIGSEIVTPALTNAENH